MRSGSSIDIQCASLSLSYESYLNNKHKKQKEGFIDTGHSQEQLKSMLEAVKGKGNGNIQE